MRVSQRCRSSCGQRRFLEEQFAHGSKRCRSALFVFYIVLGLWLFVAGCTSTVPGTEAPPSDLEQVLDGTPADVKSVGSVQSGLPTEPIPVPATTTGYVPHPNDTLPIPWADFYEMHDPTRDGGGMDISGALVIDGRCVYLDLRPDYEFIVAEPERLVLSLPRGRFQYDSKSGELWMHHRTGEVEGPLVVGQRVSVGGIYGGRSQACENEIIVASDTIWGCRRWPTANYPLCEIEEYARYRRVQRDEAQRRFDLFPVLQAAFEELRQIEADRAAAWGFDHGLDFVAWFALTGPEPPSDAAQALAGEYDDLEIRIGATTNFAQLTEAMEHFADGQQFFLPNARNADDVGSFELGRAVTKVWVDHPNNRLAIAIDPDWIPRQVAAVMLGIEQDAYSDTTRIRREEVLAVIEEFIMQRLHVPVGVAWALRSP